MTALSGTTGMSGMSGIRQLRQSAPPEGWLTAVLLSILGLTLAWSIADARWVLGNPRLTDFLPWTILGGMLVGFAGARLGWGRWTTHLIGAILAALIVPIIVGSILVPKGGSPAEWFRATADSSVDAWFDLAVKAQTLTRQYGHSLLIMGLLMWGTGQFAAVSTFFHHRPLSSVLVLGIFLVGNMAATLNDQLILLVVFSLAALFLLIRLHAVEEQTTWVRRRIGDPAVVGSMYLRGGSAFVVAAVIGALFLTSSASSAPLAGAWTGAEQWLIDTGRGLQRYFSFVQQVRGPSGVDFGPTAPITGRWITDNTPAVQIKVPTGTRKVYWQAGVYDSFDGNGWSQSGDQRVNRGANAPLLEGTSEAPIEVGHERVTATVTPASYHGSTVMSAGTPIAVDAATQLSLIGEDGFFVTLETAGGSRPYNVTGLVPFFDDEKPNGLTVHLLEAAGTDYPDDVVATYLSLPGDLGPASQAILDRVKGRVPDGNAYDLASAMVSELHSGTYTYKTDVTDLACGDLDVVECFAKYKQGYCMYYASTMAVLLREAGIPTRLVQGFLPGDRSGDGVETIRNSNSHAWVQVYFPKYGWIDFDPTGGNVSRLPLIPLGSPVPIPSASLPSIPAASQGVRPGQNDPSEGPGGGTTTGSSSGTGTGPFIVIGALLLIGVVSLGLIAYRRGPRGGASPDDAYRGVTRLAARFGFGPRPTQTVYEYAAALGEVLPLARPDLEMVAHAKVEVAYGRRELASDRIRSLGTALGRLRLNLLRLALRRRERSAFRRRR